MLTNAHLFFFTEHFLLTKTFRLPVLKILCIKQEIYILNTKHSNVIFEFTLINTRNSKLFQKQKRRWIEIKEVESIIKYSYILERIKHGSKITRAGDKT